MIKHLTSEQLAHIARNGGGLELDGATYTSEQLAHIARNLAGGATLKVHNSQHLTSEQLAHIARNCPGKVVFA